ncbi:uncharacterized protein LOC100907508 [Galendromus occidentalis]|uniref:Uncharacterized protein LOC100907508 n=1 Tax=Galendromus occidentalis TaxID=34638 RepID=A0AAJ7WH66_9ACAR|nr:uncharacterized protein LOC100907508 [Galendromus occidentalis]
MPATIRKLVPEDLPNLSKFLGRSVMEFFGNTLVALDENDAIVGALSFSRTYSTWEDRSMAVNTVRAPDATVLKQLLVALIDVASAEKCSRVDAHTSDPQLAAALKDLGSLDLTTTEEWRLYEMTNLQEFLSKPK